MSQNTNNTPFTTEELTAGLQALWLSKAAGPDRIPSEFYRQAYVEHSFVDPATWRRHSVREYAVAQTLAMVFNKLQESGGVTSHGKCDRSLKSQSPKGTPFPWMTTPILRWDQPSACYSP
jgi:hypothetical protein